MPDSRRKGARAEHEWANRWGGRKLSRLGYEGPDVETPPLAVTGLELWEVKVRQSLPAWLEAWQEQAERQGCDGIVFRRDRGSWWVMVPADRLEHLGGEL